MKRMRIHREGRTILLSLLTMLCVVNVLLYWHVKTNPIIVASLILSVLAFSFFLYFFRSPTRVIDIDDPSLIIAPADGKIVVIEETEELEYFKDKRIQVSIFMSVFSVHANWYPIKGLVKFVRHHKGRFMAAYLPKSSTENERSTIVLESEKKTPILMRQVAGALARRIVTYAHEGKYCNVNEHLGFIKFGSRIDLYLPLDTEIFVEVGEGTVGNETVIARLNE
ncbi:MAG: phosphatidylserine decarboxylase family protein [Paludibacteraceae bacterium]|jgi:phosphatidylserine decarboxylase|nr:phosphatidylserine decarboxylase family protein [Paludibacteraceae bacterium]MBQ5779271.1 phosphatidylserine decarboxylase family protein [Paludibacteraceae bacterium]